MPSDQSPYLWHVSTYNYILFYIFCKGISVGGTDLRLSYFFAKYGTVPMCKS